MVVERLLPALAACCLHWLPAHLGGVRERSEHLRSLPLSTPNHLPAQKGPGLACGKVAEGRTMSCLRRQHPGPSPRQRRWLCQAPEENPPIAGVCLQLAAEEPRAAPARREKGVCSRAAVLAGCPRAHVRSLG